MEEKSEFVGYYRYIKRDLNKYKDVFDDYIFYLPEFFKLLCALLNTNIEKEDRRKIACVLGYFVLPDDVISEKTYGPIGYIDDIFLCCYVLNEIRDKYGSEIIYKHWDHDENFEDVLDHSFSESSRIIEKKNLKNRILGYVGLD